MRTEDGRSREAVTVRNPGTRGARTRERRLAKWSLRTPKLPRVQTYPRRERGEPACSRTPHGRSKDRVTNNSADTSVAGAMVVGVWFARAPRIAYPFVQVGHGCEGKTRQRPGPCEVEPGKTAKGRRHAASGPTGQSCAHGSRRRARLAVAIIQGILIDEIKDVRPFLVGSDHQPGAGRESAP